jgi:iron complex outermembrane recepter protein
MRITRWLLIVTFSPLGAALAADANVDPAAGGGDTAALRLDAVHVTGTRLRRIDLEGPLPVTAIEREELEASGRTTLSDFLRELPFNSFGTALDEPTRRVPGQRQLNLRGLGAAYTLVLLDGQRLPGNSASMGGAVTNLSGLPLSAIERVEVLRDGASAVYGSEAIGGVVNLVTRRGDLPLTLGLQWDHPSEGGGRLRAADLVWGREQRDGDLLLALQVAGREPLRATERPYLVENAPLSPLGAPGSFRRIDPVSGAPFGSFETDPRCPARPGESVQFPSSGRLTFGPNQLCGYRFRDDALEQTGLDSLAGFASLRQGLGDRLRLGARLMLLRNEGETMAAASPVGNLRIAADSSFNPTRGELGPDLGYDLSVLYRLTPLGLRRNESREDSLHLATELVGDAWGGDWRLGAQHNRQSLESLGVSGFARFDALQSILADGRFDPFSAVPGEPGVLAQALFSPWVQGRSRGDGIDAHFRRDAFDLRHGPVEIALGASLRRDRYRLRFDPESLRGNIIGSPGGAEADAGRSHAAAFLEALLPLTPSLEANLALRYDRYQDSGSALSPKLALAWRPLPSLLLRAAAGRGFRVIDLEAGYAATSRSVGFVIDAVRCAEAPGDPEACALVPAELDFPSNPRLQPERSRQETLGLVWQPSAASSIGVDFYRVRLRDQIGRLTPVEVARNELLCGQACDPLRDGIVERDALGNISRLVVPAVNIAALRTRGVDVELRHALDLGPGRLAASLRVTRVLRFERQTRPDQEGEDRLGLFSFPRQRAQAALDYDLQRYTLHAGVRHVGGYRSCFARLQQDGLPDPACALAVRSHTEIDLRLGVDFDWNGRLALGVRNVGNRRAPLSSDGQIAYGLHDIVGRVPYLRYEQRF